MTDRELIQQALDALDRVMSHGSAVQEAKDILRDRLAQPEQGPRQWQGMTDDEISAASKGHMTRNGFARAVESKLKSKNT